RRVVTDALPQDPAFDRKALVDRAVAGTDLLEHGIEVARLGLRQEPELAEVDAEQRDVDLGDGSCRAKERAITAEHDEGIGRRQLRREGFTIASLGAPFIDAAPASAPGGARHELAGALHRRVVCEADPTDGHAAITSAMRFPTSAQ